MVGAVPALTGDPRTPRDRMRISGVHLRAEPVVRIVNGPRGTVANTGADAPARRGG